MTISKELMLAILSMDAYNRGYGAGITGLGGAGSKVGKATIRDDDLPAGAQDAGFYAVSYTMGDGVDGINSGATVISYRGTDNLELASSSNDILNGWVSGAGFTTGQVPLALDFYENVTGKKYYESAENTLLTGHSLGGGLSLITSALSGTAGYGYDHSPYGIAAYAQSFSVPDDENGNGHILSTDNLTGINVTGEVLQGARSGGIQLTIGSALSLLLGPLGNALGLGQAAATRYYEGFVEQTALDSNGGLRDPFTALHSIDLLIALQFAKDNTHTDWIPIAKELWDAYFSDKIAIASGSEKLSGEAEEASKMAKTLSYSALDSSVGLVFGNTGIRAMFDDADELGSIVNRGNLPSNLNRAKQGIVEAIVQFSGQMAIQEVDYKNHTDIKPEEGILFFSKDGEIVEAGEGVDETATADIMAIDLSNELWQLRDGDGAVAGDVTVTGLQTVLDELFSAAGKAQASEMREAMMLLYGGDGSVKTIGRADFALLNDMEEVRLADRSDEEAGLSGDQAGLFVSGDGMQKIYGNMDNNILFSAGDDDWLTGGLGKDILVGRLGNDVFVDAISQDIPAGASAAADSHNDIYIGGVEYKDWVNKFLAWVLHGEQTDELQYSVRKDVDDPDSLREKGLIVQDLAAVKIGDADAVKVVIKDKNTSRVSTDHTIHIDRVKLSERSDTLNVNASMLAAPLFIDMGGFAPEKVSKDDWDELDYSALSSGITMVNGTTRNNEPKIGELKLNFTGKLATMVQVVPYALGLAPSVLTLGFLEENDPLRVTGAEKITGTQHDDVLWFGEIGFLNQYFGGWNADEYVPRYGEIDGGDGNDWIIHNGPAVINANSEIPTELGGHPDGGSIAAEQFRMTLKGGKGDDRILAFKQADNVGGTIISGGEGNDFLLNTTAYGQLYGGGGLDERIAA